MKKLGSTQDILKDKVSRQTESEEDCLPCKAKAQSVWKISVPNVYFSDPNNAQRNFKLVGEALIQFAGFSEAQVQSIFTSIGLLPSEYHLIYSGVENVAVQIYNELSKQGIQPKIEAALNKF